jgi:hypothetical protein
MIHRPPKGRPRGFTRVELAVVIVLAMIALGLLPSCVQNVRVTGSSTVCTNNLKQIGLGVHNFESTFKRLPPLFAGGTDVTGKPVSTLSGKFPYVNGAPHVLLLPYIEQDNVFKLMMLPDAKPSVFVPSWPPSPNQANQRAIPTYTCPADPGGSDGIQEGSGLGGASYAANGQLFGNTDPTTGQPSEDHPWNRGALLKGIKDGTSNTIMFAHAYMRCGGTAGDDTTPASGAVWGYYNGGLAPAGNQGPPIFMNAVISGNGNVGKGIKTAFQINPQPHNAAATGRAGCDPALPASPHSEMMILLADASVRRVQPNVNPTVWWQACSPDDGTPLPADW